MQFLSGCFLNTPAFRLRSDWMRDALSCTSVGVPRFLSRPCECRDQVRCTGQCFCCPVLQSLVLTNKYTKPIMQYNKRKTTTKTQQPTRASLRPSTHLGLKGTGELILMAIRAGKQQRQEVKIKKTKDVTFKIKQEVP